MEMTGGQALAAQLVREGVSMLFGLPGVQLDHAFDGLYGQRDRIRFIGPRNEQSTTHMADGYARTRGEVGVAMVVPGPGVLNAGAGLVTAYACSSPILLIAGQIATQHIGAGLGMLHEIPDQSEILTSLTKWAARANRPEDIPALVQEAFRQLRSGRPRPVALEVPPDVLAARADIPLLDPVPRAGFRTAPEPSLVKDAAAALKRAQHPVLLAGGGAVASGATAELNSLAHRLQAPVVLTDNGRGALSDRNPLCLTSLGGAKVLPLADVVLAVGTRLSAQIAQSVPAGAKVILLNADPHDLKAVPSAALAIEADARLGLAALTDEVGELGRSAPWCDLAAVRATCAEELERVQPQMRFVQALRSAIPDDGILVSEMTQVGYIARVAYPVYEPRTFLTPGYQGTLGYGFPTALGVKAGLPDRAVVSITGDGGFGYGLAELATARRHDIALVTVVFDDKAFGNVKRTQKTDFDGRVLGTDLFNPDYVRLAESFGVRGVRANSPEALEGALREALADNQPCLIAVPVGEMLSLRQALSRGPAALAPR
ncbi:MAG TPA: thiamine pyrophosphate-dependent enzyme [Bacillota bacterium]|nr:thiamine pyrophosphate-dependent enzyme [Bacillota bacterium]